MRAPANRFLTKQFSLFFLDVPFELLFLVFEALLLLDGMHFEEHPHMFPLPLMKPFTESPALAMEVALKCRITYSIQK